uniref:THAP-type domain-containing protein n=1 Tax=Anopheles coluzzii TaxID=1518534 RepID=A0A6E8VMH8_ANOCL
MPEGCSVASCTFNRERVKSLQLDIIFHKFPTDPLLKQKWHEFCKQGPNWKPPKNGLVCSNHFTKDDYQMTRSPLLQANRLYRMLKINAVPSIRNGVPIPIATSRVIEEATRKQLYEQLYNNGTAHGIDAVEELLQGHKNRLPSYVYRLHQFPNLCAFCFTACADNKQFFPLTQYHNELRCTIGEKFDEIAATATDKEERAALQHMLPEKVCKACLDALVSYHQYQRQLKCLRMFSTGMAQLRKGNRKPLQTLYAVEGDYLTNVLKNLNICPETEKVFNLYPETAQGVTLDMYVQEQKPEVAVAFPPVQQHTKIKVNEAPAVEMVVEQATVDAAPSISASASGLLAQKLKRGRPRKREPDGSWKETWCCPFVNVCNRWFADQASLKLHMATRHKYFKCDTCGLKVKFYDVFKKHLESHAVARALLLDHNSKSKSAGVKCDICLKVFQSAAVLEHHMQSHSSVGTGVFISLPQSGSNRFSTKGGHQTSDSACIDDSENDAWSVDPLGSEEVPTKGALLSYLDHDYM